MLTAINLLLVALLLLSVWLIKQAVDQKNQLVTLREEAKQLRQVIANDSEAGLNSDDEIKMLIAIEVTNAFELAKRESKMAKYVVNVVPDLIKDIVYKQVVTNMKEELAREGVAHNISIIYR